MIAHAAWPSRDSAWARWLRTWTLISVPGICLAALMWGPLAVLGITVLPLFMGAVLQTMALSIGGHLVLSRQTLAVCERTAVASAGLLVSAAVLGTITSSACLVLLAALLLTSPPSIGRIRRVAMRTRTTTVRPDRPARPATHRLVAALLAEPPAGMSSRQLCRAWRESYVALDAAGSVAERARLVALRQAYLDELETRDARALHAWLESGARAAGGPDRYLRDEDHRRPGAA